MSDLARQLISEAKRSRATVLDIGRCGLTDWPEEFWELTWLEELNLRNRKWDVEEEKWVSATKNQGAYNCLHYIPEEIGALEQLRRLEVGGSGTIYDETVTWVIALDNWLISDLSGLSGLMSLQNLDLRKTQVGDLKPILPLIEKGVPVVMRENSYGDEINVFECPLNSPPPETVKEGNQAILDYFAAIEESATYLFEAKLLIIGEGRVGKTTLRLKLEDIEAALPPEDLTTRGIDICPLPFQMNEEQEFVMHTWDFGGQDIYQSTHQFFFTKRSLYVLVDDASRDDTRLAQWLRKIDVLTDGSPVIVVQNQRAGRSKDVNWKGLLEGFDKGIRTPMEAFDFSLPDEAAREELQQLKKRLQQEILRLDLVGMKLPTQWVEIRKAVLKLEEEKPYLSQFEYLELCKQLGVEGTKKALDLSWHLHCLGIFLHFRNDPILRNYVILQKEWATNAVYKVFDSPILREKKGRFEREDVGSIWSGEQYQMMHDELLRLMENFELCYRIPDIPEEQYIVPQLLPKAQPDYDFPQGPSIRFEFQYESFMPDGILSRLIVRLHRYVKNLHLAWQQGVILFSNGTQAEIIEQIDGGKIRIRIHGPEAQFLMGTIVDHLDAIHNKFGSEMIANVKKRIPCNCKNCKALLEAGKVPHFYFYDNLITRRERGKRTVECDVPNYEEVSVQGLLDAVFRSTEGRDRVPARATLLDWIANNQLKDVLEAIAPHSHEVILFQASLNRLEEEFRQERITRKVFSADLTDLSNRVIKTLDTLSWLR